MPRSCPRAANGTFGPWPRGVENDVIIDDRGSSHDFYTKAWPVAVVAFLVLVGVSVALNPRPTGAEAASDGAHECWEAADGSVNGCRMASGRIVGTSVGTPVTCYFDEAKVEEQETISCDK